MARRVAEVRAAWKAVEYYRVCEVPRSGGKSHVHDYTHRRFFLHDSHIREVSVTSNHAMERTTRMLMQTFLTLALLMATSATVASAQKVTDTPLFIEYKGVRIGMDMNEARKKLGEP